MSKLRGLVEENLNQSILQGNDTEPIAQRATSIPMCQVMRQLNYEIYYIIVITKEKAKTLDFIIVNNMNLAAGQLYCFLNNINEVFEDI